MTRKSNSIAYQKLNVENANKIEALTFRVRLYGINGQINYKNKLAHKQYCKFCTFYQNNIINSAHIITTIFMP